MGFLDKLKNTFFEEEYIEVEDEENDEQAKPLARKIDTKTEDTDIHESQQTRFVDKVEDSFVDDTTEEAISSMADKDLVKNDSIQYFEDDDFEDTSSFDAIGSEKGKTKAYSIEENTRLYEPKYETEGPYKPYATQPVVRKFVPTPIISPIYGILDKNYKKDEVIEKKDKPSSYVSRRNVDLDYVRNKAFGTSNLEEKEEVVEDKAEENFFVDMIEEECPCVDKVTIADAEEYFEDLGLEYNVDYKDKNYKKGTTRRSKKNDEEAPIIEEKDNSDANDVMEVIEELAIKKDGIKEEDDSVKIDDLIEEAKNFDDPKDNLFDLIDSMYDEKEEDD